MIDRRHVLLGLAGLIVPAVARAQSGPGGPGPGGQPGGPPSGNQTRPEAIEQRNALPSAPQPDQVGVSEQPPRIRALILSQSYQGTPDFALANTTRDATLIARTFQRLRFDQVTTHSDGTAADTVARIATYLRSVDANTIALVYVARHGVEIGGENLLMLEGATAFLSLQAMVQVLRERAGITILFLDACRNNPFTSRAAAGAWVSRAVPLEGEVRFDTVSLDELRAQSSGAPGRLRAFALQGGGIKIIFSTDPANVALDGVGPRSRNSPFARALARYIREPLSLDDIISLTTGEVVRTSRRTQFPWSQGSIDRPIYLSGRRRREQARLG